jgi:hypothetical protein
MIKKIILIYIFSSLLLSCGVKAPPEYEGNEIPVPKNLD